MAVACGVHGLGGIKAPERAHQRARLAADAHRWAQWVLLRSERPKRRAALALPLGDLVGALFLHRLGWFLLGRFLLCHALSH